MAIKRKKILKNNKEEINKEARKMNEKTIKPLRIKFCPGCKSADVRFVFRMQNLFGLIPRIECLRCGNYGSDFPILIVNPEDKNKRNKRVVKKTKKVKKKKAVKKTKSRVKKK